MKPDPNLSDAENLSILYSFPLWLVEQWIEDYGLAAAEEILKPLDTDNYTTIRVNTLKTSKKDLKAKLESCGIEVFDGLYLDEALRFASGGRYRGKPVLSGR